MQLNHPKQIHTCRKAYPSRTRIDRHCYICVTTHDTCGQMRRDNETDDSPPTGGGDVTKNKANPNSRPFIENPQTSTEPSRATGKNCLLRSTRSRGIHPVGTIVRKRFDDGEYFEGEVTGYDDVNKWYEIKYLDGTEEDYDEAEMKKYYKELQKYSHEPYTALRETTTQDETGNWSVLQAPVVIPELVMRKSMPGKNVVVTDVTLTTCNVPDDSNTHAQTATATTTTTTRSEIRDRRSVMADATKDKPSNISVPVETSRKTTNRPTGGTRKTWTRDFVTWDDTRKKTAEKTSTAPAGTGAKPAETAPKILNRTKPMNTTPNTTPTTDSDQSSWYWLVESDGRPAIAGHPAPPVTSRKEEEEARMATATDDGSRNTRSTKFGSKAISRSRTNDSTDSSTNSRPPRSSKHRTKNSANAVVETGNNISERVKMRTSTRSLGWGSCPSTTPSSSYRDIIDLLSHAESKLSSMSTTGSRSKRSLFNTRAKSVPAPPHSPRMQRRGTRSSLTYDIGTIVRKRITDQEGDDYQEGEVVGYDVIQKLYKITYLDGTFDNYDHEEMSQYYKALQKYSHENYNALRSLPKSKNRSSPSAETIESGIRSRLVDEEGNLVKGKWSWLIAPHGRAVIADNVRTTALATSTSNALSEEQSTTTETATNVTTTTTIAPASNALTEEQTTPKVAAAPTKFTTTTSIADRCSNSKDEIEMATLPNSQKNSTDPDTEIRKPKSKWRWLLAPDGSPTTTLSTTEIIPTQLHHDDVPKTTGTVRRSHRQHAMHSSTTDSEPNNQNMKQRLSTRSSRAIISNESPERNATASVQEMSTTVSTRTRKRKQMFDSPKESCRRGRRNNRRCAEKERNARNNTNSATLRSSTPSARAITLWEEITNIVHGAAAQVANEDGHSVALRTSTRSSRAAGGSDESRPVKNKDNHRVKLHSSKRSSKRSEQNIAATPSLIAANATKDNHSVESYNYNATAASNVTSTAKSPKDNTAERSSATYFSKENNHSPSRASVSDKKDVISAKRRTAKEFRITTMKQKQKQKQNDILSKPVQPTRRSGRQRRQNFRLAFIDHVLFSKNWSQSRRSRPSKQDSERKQVKETISIDTSAVQLKNSNPLCATHVDVGSESRQETKSVSSDGTPATADTTIPDVETRIPAPGKNRKGITSTLIEGDRIEADKIESANVAVSNLTETKTKRENMGGKSIDVTDTLVVSAHHHSEGMTATTVKSNIYTFPSDPSPYDIYAMCRNNKWHCLHHCIQSNPKISTTQLLQGYLSFSTTTILHQAILSKGDGNIRAAVIQQILRVAPEAAAIKDSNGSFPLHEICQHRLKMSLETKEELIDVLIDAYPDALNQAVGKMMRTPLHFACKDYFLSPRLLETMIQRGPRACSIRDKHGFLPAHIACSNTKSGRNISPEKLQSLLEVNPDALFAETSDGRTLLTLAKGTETASKPNYELLSFIETRMKSSSTVTTLSVQTSDSKIDNPSFDDCASQIENVETANLLLQLAGRFQNDPSNTIPVGT